MVSDELLSQYREFSSLTGNQLHTLASITDEKTYEKGELVFEEAKPADHMFLLLEGGVDLYYVVEEIEFRFRKEFHVGRIVIGEVFGLSAVIDPYRYETSARATTSSKILKIDGIQLRQIMEADNNLAYNLFKELMKVINHKLQGIRTELSSSRTIS